MIVERSCIICRKKAEKKSFFRLCLSEESCHWDKTGKEQARGYYVCRDKNCLLKLSKHKKIKIKVEELYKMSKEIEQSSIDYLNILRIMKQAGVLSFGMQMIMEEMDHIHFLVIAKDISEKYARQLEEQASVKKIPFEYFGNKQELARLFGKQEVTVIAVKDKKMARGLINKKK